MISHQSPGPFGGMTTSWVQGQWLPRSGTPPTRASSMPEQEQPTPASSASSFQHADAPPAQSTALPSTSASSVGAPLGTIGARPTTAAASHDNTFIVTLGAGPWTTIPSGAGISDDQMVGPQPGATSGL